MAIVVPAGQHGGYSDQLVLPARSVARIPAGATLVEAATLPMNGLTARKALDMLALPAGATIGVTGAAGAFGGYVVQLAKADGLRVVADASEADEALVRSLGADFVVRRGDDVASRIREVVPEGLDAVADGAIQHALVLPADPRRRRGRRGAAVPGHARARHHRARRVGARVPAGTGEARPPRPSGRGRAPSRCASPGPTRPSEPATPRPGSTPAARAAGWSSSSLPTRDRTPAGTKACRSATHAQVRDARPVCRAVPWRVDSVEREHRSKAPHRDRGTVPS